MLALAELGVAARTVRRPDDLPGLAGSSCPAGSRRPCRLLLQSSGLFEPLAQALGAGLPALGTCAGLVLLARSVLDGRPDQRVFGVLDCTVRRNGYGRQLQSFESRLAVPRLDAELGTADGALPAVFIRAPVVEAVGPEVDVLACVARHRGEPATPAIVRQGPVLAATFHPELTADRRVHRLFVRLAGA